MEAQAEEYSIDAVLNFLDSIKDEGTMKPQTVRSVKAACNSFKDILNDEEKQDVRRLDFEALAERMATLKGDQHSPGTLREYRRRFQRAIGDFLRYRENPEAWKAEAAGGRKRRSANAAGRSGEVPGSLPKVPRHVQAPDALVFPYPLRPDVVVYIHNLPRDLTRAEAQRLGAFLQTLATDYAPHGDRTN